MTEYSMKEYKWVFCAEPNKENNYIDCKLRKDSKTGEVVAYARLYPIKNTIHKRDYGLLEDVFVYKQWRNMGIGNWLITHIINYAKKNNMYKIIATSRFERKNVHKLYEDIGLKKWGHEFRMDLE